MQAATGYGVAGIVADAAARCAAPPATCTGPDWAEQLPPPASGELEMLGYTADERLPTSRLACQIRLTAELQGMVVRVPEIQQ
jgi:2Fe-2S ferredoxin